MAAERETAMQLVEARRLKPAEWNPRIVYEEQFKQLMRGIRDDPDFLHERPILATTDGTIYAGNMRYHALVALYTQGWRCPWGAGELVPVSIRDIPDTLAKARAIRDNLHAGNWQEMELGAILAEIASTPAGEAALPNLGLRDDELRNIMAAAGIGDSVDPFTMRRQDTLPAEAGGPSGGSGGENGTDSRGGPLTLVLHFSDVIALTDALHRLDDRRWRTVFGHSTIDVYDEHGKRLEH
jgi:hypothetical protein